MKQKHNTCAVCFDEVEADTNKLCDSCIRCPECGEQTLAFYEYEAEGEPTMECLTCGKTYHNKSITSIHDSIIKRYNRLCLLCGVSMGRFVPDTESCLCIDCFRCPRCNEQLDMRNNKPYCWFCHQYWMPKSIHKSVGISHGKERMRADDTDPPSDFQLDSARREFTLEEYYQKISSESSVDGDDNFIRELKYLKQ